MGNSKKARLWARRISAFKRSGQTRRVWCDARGLSANTLDYWRVQLRDDASDSPSSKRAAKSVTKQAASRSRSLVPIVIKAPARTSALDRSIADAWSALVEIELPSGARIRASSGMDADWLAALVRTLLTC